MNRLMEKEKIRDFQFSPRRDLNSRPLVYKTSALTPELRRRTWKMQVKFTYWSPLNCYHSLSAGEIFVSLVSTLLMKTIYFLNKKICFKSPLTSLVNQLSWILAFISVIPMELTVTEKELTIWARLKME